MSAIAPIARLGSASAAGNDSFLQKVGDWAWQVATPTIQNVNTDARASLAFVAVDAPVMEYLEAGLAATGLPVAHLYDGALEMLAAKIDDPKVAAILQQDVQLRAYLRERRQGELYE